MLICMAFRMNTQKTKSYLRWWQRGLCPTCRLTLQWICVQIHWMGHGQVLDFLSQTQKPLLRHMSEKFSRIIEAADRTTEKRIDKLAKELAQESAELLEVWAAFVQLTQKKFRDKRGP